MEEVIDTGDRVVLDSHRATGHGRGVGLRSTLPLSSPPTPRDGKVIKLIVYNDQVEALEAAGLSE